MSVYGISIAQNDLQQSNYMFNELSFNPAYTGSNNTLRGTLMARKQWIGFDYGPFTQTLCVDGKTRIGGVGMSIINDELGYERSLHAKAMYAYTVELSEKTALSAGFAAGAIHSMLDGTKLQYQDQMLPDPNGIYDNQSNISPTIDFGLHFLQNNFALGVSSTHIYTSLSSSQTFQVPRHLYGYMQYRWNVSEKVSLVPTAFAKRGSTIEQYEINTNVYINKKFWVGGTYRYQESAVGLLGIILKEQFYIGYAYDFNIGDLYTYSDGSHEIFISFRKKPQAPQSGFYQSTRLFN